MESLFLKVLWQGTEEMACVIAVVPPSYKGALSQHGWLRACRRSSRSGSRARVRDAHSWTDRRSLHRLIEMSVKGCMRASKTSNMKEAKMGSGRR